MSIDGLSDLGSGNEDDALHNRVANEERAAMATVLPNAEQDDREEDAPPPPPHPDGLFHRRNDANGM